MSRLPAIGTDAIPPNRNNCRQAGFTLIEIAIVMAIIGMVMLLVLPRLPTSDQENLKISARTLASTLRYMQERAATSRTAVFSHSDTGNRVRKDY